MIEYRHADPNAFNPVENDGWRRVSRFKYGYWNFDRFEYRIFGEVYTRNDTAWRKALEAHEMWEKLQGRKVFLLNISSWSTDEKIS